MEKRTRARRWSSTRPVRDSDKRIKLEEFEVTRLPGGRCLGRVTVGWHHGNGFVGTAEAPDSPHGQVRCAAEATALALERATRNKVALQVLAVKEIEGSGTVLVVVSFAVEDVMKRLVGAGLAVERPSRGAVLAVLNATNRVLSPAVSE